MFTKKQLFSTENQNRIFKFIKFFVVISLVIFLVLWIFVQIFSYSPESKGYKDSKQDVEVSVKENFDHFVITPNNLKSESIPIIFYPGGLVSPKSYLSKLIGLSKQQHTKIFLIKPFFNLAILNINATLHLINQYNLKSPIIGGHSLGGVAACRFVKDNPNKISGLFLLGSYCDKDISNFPGSVVSIVGLKDGIINQKNYQNTKTNLPKSATLLEIPELNHSSFGNYGLQKGDNPSPLSNLEVLEILKSIAPDYSTQ